MFDWLGDIVSGLGEAIGNAFSGISDSIIDGILNRYIQWLFKIVFDRLSDLGTGMTCMARDIFWLS